MAADRRAQEDRLIQQMLTTSGYSQVDMRFVLTLPANSPERQMLAQVCVWVWSVFRFLSEVCFSLGGLGDGVGLYAWAVCLHQ
jgi:hypothetical protein